jgi:hypothetical protein
MLPPTGRPNQLGRVLCFSPLLLPILLTLVFAAALAARLVNLGAFGAKFDEGIRAEQLLLMRAGFRPVRDIFTAQGPLSLHIFYPAYVLLGETLTAARGAVVLYSMLGLLAVYWTARQAAGRPAGLLAVLLLALSPLYLKNSRLALLEVPALAPATVALGAALRYQACREASGWERRLGSRWLLISAASLAIALLIKPIVVGVAPPIGLALLLRPGRRWRDLLRYGLVVAAIAALVALLYGPGELWEQEVVYRDHARRATGWSLKENWSILGEELRDESLASYGLAAVCAPLLVALRPRLGLPLASWPLASLGLLLVYSPLQFKHAVILFPPLALVSAAGLAVLADARWKETPIGGRIGLGLAALLAVWYIASLGTPIRSGSQVVNAAGETRGESFGEEVQLISQLSRPDGYIVVDEPIVAFDSRRLVPPYLVDPSTYRVRSGTLRGEEVVEATERFDARLLFLYSDGLRDLRRFGEYVDQRYRAVRISERPNGKDRALYLRDDSDFETARSVVARQADRPLRADFAGQLRLVGFSLGREEARPGLSAALTLHWEALQPIPVDYRVVTHLRAGEADLLSERSLGGGGEGTSSWEPGRWVVRTQSLPIPARAAVGDYTLSVSVYDSRARVFAPVTAGAGAGGSEAPLGAIRVR